MPSTCPSPDDWQCLLRGAASDADADRLEAHLDTCMTCRALLPDLKVDDPVLKAMRAQPPLVRAEKDLVQGLIQRVKYLLHSSATHALSSESSEDVGRYAESLSGAQASRVGQHLLVRLLGSGGMGLVFEAHDEALHRTVALKVMTPKLAASSAARQRFLREARAVAALDHPHIVHIYQVGEDAGIPFFIMEFLRGETLAERLLRQPRSTPRAIAGIGAQIAQGLAAAHARGLIHRDIKPANIFLLEKDEGGRMNDEEKRSSVKILDFGLVHVAEDDARLTRVGDVLGTPAYMSPEQARGDRIDARADLFSLGCILYELCTGFSPFQAIDSTALLLPTSEAWPRPPSDLNPHVPDGLSELIVHLLAREPAGRPASAQEVAERLHALEQGGEGDPAPRVKKSSKMRQLRRGALAAYVLALLILAGIVRFVPPRPEDPPVAGVWTQREPLTQARSNAMATALDGRLYLAGGVIPEWHLDTLDVFDPATGVWKSLAPMPRTDDGHNGRSNGSLGVIDGKLYLAGGWRHKPPLPTKTLLIYDPQSNTWENGPHVPTLSGDSVGGVIEGKFYVLIGTNGNDGLRHLFYVYDSDRRFWKELKPAPRPHSQGGAGVIGAKLYVIGGDTAQGASAGLDVYDPATDTWTTLSPMPTPRVGPATAVLNDKLIVLGGEIILVFPVYLSWLAVRALPPRSKPRYQTSQ